MSSAIPDYPALARASLGAATSATEPLVVAYYLASARIAYQRAVEELRSIELVLVAREREAAMRAAPRQLAIDSTEGSASR